METIRKHLSDEQWAELLSPRSAGAEHLAECHDCGREFDNLRAAVTVLPEWARSAGQQPEDFWDRQRLAIRSRIAHIEAPVRSSARLAWITALGLILFASFILRTGSRMPAPRAQADPDHALLIAVEQALDGDVPEALQPASLLAEEMEEAVQHNSPSRNSKENAHAN